MNLIEDEVVGLFRMLPVLGCFTRRPGILATMPRIKRNEINNGINKEDINWQFLKKVRLWCERPVSYS